MIYSVAFCLQKYEKNRKMRALEEKKAETM